MDTLVEERWRDVRRHHLLEAAGRAFARQGYEAASVEDIAFEAGIGKPTLYRYFPSKTALFEAVLAEAFHDLESRLDAALLLPGAFEQRLLRLISEIVPTVRAHFGSFGAISEGESEKRRLFRQRRSLVEARLRAVIEAAQAAGQARPFDAALAASMIVGMIRTGVGLEQRSDAEVAETVVGVALYGLSAHAGADHV